MIAPGAIGAGPIVRPFFNRGGHPPVIPLAANTWGPLGTNSSGLGSLASLTLPNIGIAAGETIFSALICDNAVNVDGLTSGSAVSFAGVFTNVSGPQLFGAKGLWLCYLGNNTGSDLYGDWVYDFSTSTGQPDHAVMLCSRVSTLNVAINSLDKSKSATGTSATQDSTLTVLTTQPKEFLWGTIGTAGNPGDTLGNWQTGFTAGQRATISGLDLKEGYNFVLAAGNYRAEVLLATSRQFRAQVTTYKGI